MTTVSERACIGTIAVLAAFLAPTVGGLPFFGVPGGPGLSSGEKASSGVEDLFAYHAVNDVIYARIGELSGGSCWSDDWNYRYDPYLDSTSVFSQEYSLWFGGAIHRSRTDGCSLPVPTDFTVEDYFGNGINDPDNYARTRSGNFTVGMTVTIDGRPRSPGEASFVQIVYDVTNTGSVAEADVRFFALVDYDIPNTTGDNYTDDTSDYDPMTDTVWVRDPRFFKAGLSASDRRSSAHGMDAYEIELWGDDGDGVLNGLDSYGPADPGVGEQWNIGTMEPGASWTVTVVFSFNAELVIADAGGPYNGVEGTVLSFDASASRGTGPLQYRWSFDGRVTWGPWSPSPTTFNTWFDDFSGFACVQVSNGAKTRGDCDPVTVANLAPTVAAWASPSPGMEGQPVTFDGEFLDPGSLDTQTAIWYFGDGSASVPGTFSPGVGYQQHEMDAVSHTYGRCGQYNATLTVVDDDRGQGTAIISIEICAADPSVTLFPPDPLGPQEGAHVTFNGSFEDPGWLNTHTASWDFGDGSPIQPGAFSPGAGYTHHEMDAIQHTYDQEGMFTVWLTVRDECGAEGRASLQITVQPPSPDYEPRDAQPVGPTIGFSLYLALSLEVLNSGDGPASSSATLAFYNESMPGTPFATFSVPPLDSQSRSARFEATWFSPGTPGVYSVIADVDYGNQLVEENESNNLHAWSIRVVPGPLTILAIGSPNITAGSTYVTSATLLSFSVLDRGDTGIRATRVRIDADPWFGYTIPCTLSGDGEHSVQWYSEDYAGNVEATHSMFIRVDDTPPQTTISPTGSNAIPDTAFLLTATDSGSGVARTEYRVDGGEWLQYEGEFFLSAGNHVIGYRSADRLNNTEVERTLPVTVATPPGTSTTNWKPLVAAIFATVLAILGAWSSRRSPWPTGTRRRLRAFFLSALPFVVAEAATGAVSLLTGLLAIPPLLDSGTVVDLTILVGGILVSVYRLRKGKPAT